MVIFVSFPTKLKMASTGTVEEFHKEGMEMFEHKEYDSAVRTLAKVMEMAGLESPLGKSAQYHVALSLIALGNSYVGLGIMKESAQQDYPPALYYYGRHLESQGSPHANGCYFRAMLLGNDDAKEALKIKGTDGVVIIMGQNLAQYKVPWHEI